MGGCIASALTGWSAVEVVDAILGIVEGRRLARKLARVAAAGAVEPQLREVPDGAGAYVGRPGRACPVGRGRGAGRRHWEQVKRLPDARITQGCPDSERTGRTGDGRDHAEPPPPVVAGLPGDIEEQVTQAVTDEPQPAALAVAAQQDLGNGQADQLGVQQPGRPARPRRLPSSSSTVTDSATTRSSRTAHTRPPWRSA
jgi:hypothetical protein